MGEPIAPDALEAARYVVATAEWISGEVDEDPEMEAKIEQGAKVIHALLERAPREPDLYAAPPDVEGLVEACRSAMAVIECVENRCMAVDGPVTPTADEIDDDELREIYHGLRRALAACEGGKNDEG